MDVVVMLVFAVSAVLAGPALGIAALLRATRFQTEWAREHARFKRDLANDLAGVRARLTQLEAVAVTPVAAQPAVVEAEADTEFDPEPGVVVGPEAELESGINDQREVEPAAQEVEPIVWAGSDGQERVPEWEMTEEKTEEVTVPATGAWSAFTDEPAAVDAGADHAPAGTVDGAGRRARTAVWNFEEALGAKVFVWIGGVALALAGAFLVKYSWDNQLLSVGTRLLIAAVFGVAMVGAGTWLRTRSERVAAALVGAGVADLYGVTFAASSVYHFLGPVTGFVLLALVTAGAVALSLRHGRFVALLGLVGGFCTPLLIGDARAADGPLLGYLLVLQIGLVVVTRQRGWIGLSAATLVGSVGWGLVQALTGVDGGDRLAAGILGLGSAAVFVLNAAWVQARDQDVATRRRPISPFGLAVSALAAAGALLGIVTVRGGYGPQELAMVGLLGAGAIALGRLDRRYLAIPWLTLGLSVAMLVGSLVSRGTGTAETSGFAGVVLAFAALYAAGGYAASWGSRRGLRVSAVSFASLAAVGGVVLLGLGVAAVPAALAGAARCCLAWPRRCTPRWRWAGCVVGRTRPSRGRWAWPHGAWSPPPWRSRCRGPWTGFGSGPRWRWSALPQRGRRGGRACATTVDGRWAGAWGRCRPSWSCCPCLSGWGLAGGGRQGAGLAGRMAGGGLRNGGRRSGGGGVGLADPGRRKIGGCGRCSASWRRPWRPPAWCWCLPCCSTGRARRPCGGSGRSGWVWAWSPRRSTPGPRGWAGAHA